MEKRHLHNGINPRTEAAFTGNAVGVDNIQLRLFLRQNRLNILRDMVPDLIRRIRAVEQENPAWRQFFRHFIFVEELPLMTGNKIRLPDQIGSADRLFADAQMRNGKAARLFRVIDKKALGVIICVTAEDLNGIFGRRNRTVTAQPVKQRTEAVCDRQLRRNRCQGQPGDIINNTGRKAAFRRG